jgi:hypothetical protein
MIRPVAPRWNTLTEVIGRALKIRDALNLLVHLEQHNKKGVRGMNLMRFKLAKQEWDLLTQLFPLLDVCFVYSLKYHLNAVQQVFLQATKKISQSETPLLHEVIPICDVITRALDDYIDDKSKFPAVRAAARRGLVMLNKYYALTDDSVMYRVAMCKQPTVYVLYSDTRLVLHPRYKTSYFVRAKWPREWITTAEQILREQWEMHYKPAAQDTNVPQVCLYYCMLSNIVIVFPKTATSTSSANNYFAEIDNFGAPTAANSDVIAEWLTSPPLLTVSDPIGWWIAMEKAGHLLAPMALDFLSAPGRFCFLA